MAGNVTRFVTRANALVLSPIEMPERPEALPDVFDAFLRAAAGLRDGTLGAAWDEGTFYAIPRMDPHVLFRATPLLRDGTTLPAVLPPSWAGRVTPERVAAYFRSTLAYFDREPSWGAQMPYASVARVGDVLEVRLADVARKAYIDPLRDLAVIPRHVVDKREPA